MSEASVSKITFKDFETDQEVRWCPGCGDYSILKAVQRTLEREAQYVPGLVVFGRPSDGSPSFAAGELAVSLSLGDDGDQDGVALGLFPGFGCVDIGIGGAATLAAVVQA